MFSRPPSLWTDRPDDWLTAPPREPGSEPDAAAAVLPTACGRLAPSRINAIYAGAGKSVVSVQATSGGGTASGTGFVIDRKGTIVTNAHVVENATSARVRFDDAAAPVEARIVGTDPSTDLAVLHVDPSETSSPTGNVGIGFAVPSDAVREVVPKLPAGQSIERPAAAASTP